MTKARDLLKSLALVNINKVKAGCEWVEIREKCDGLNKEEDELWAAVRCFLNEPKISGCIPCGKEKLLEKLSEACKKEVCPTCGRDDNE